MFNNSFSDVIKNITDAYNKGKGDPTKKLPQDKSGQFANWANTTDTREMAKDLMDRGMLGAEQMYNDQVVPNSVDNIRNRQGDWKVAMMQNILSNAYKMGIKTPEQVMANKDVLINIPKYKDAVNNWAFGLTHPNFWQFVSQNFIPQRWQQWDAQQQSNTLTQK